MSDFPLKYDPSKDEMVPVTQADWDSAMAHIRKQRAELERLRAFRKPRALVPDQQ